MDHAYVHARALTPLILRQSFGTFGALLVSRAFPACTRSIVTEMCLCQVCSRQEIEDGHAGQTTGAQVLDNQVLPRIVSRWPHPAALAAANVDELEHVLRRAITLYGLVSVDLFSRRAVACVR